MRVEWRVAKMVVVYLLKVASWCEWRRWRHGVNGVIVEMLVVAMFVVVVAPK